MLVQLELPHVPICKSVVVGRLLLLYDFCTAILHTFISDHVANRVIVTLCHI